MFYVDILERLNLSNKGSWFSPVLTWAMSMARDSEFKFNGEWRGNDIFYPCKGQ